MPHTSRPAHPESAHVAGEPAHDRVVFHPCSAQSSGHDLLTKASLAASLARLLGIDFAGAFDARRRPEGRLYFVPSETLPEQDAVPLGIRQPHDLYGGVTPRAFVATKVITHPLLKSDAAAPSGWSPRFGDRVRDVVLEGFSVFSAADARVAGAQLLSGGAVRVKHPGGVGGAGQSVVNDLTQLESVLASMTAADLRRDGLVLERNLGQVRTHSVGQVQVGRWRIAYYGRQRLTRNHHGHEVYGGSNLRVVRGGYDTLLGLELPDAARAAVEQALAFHEAAMASFPGLYASRSNYDIAQGYDDAGIWRSGVLEQSWRIGGASGAELAALHALRDEPSLAWVDASTHEIYADDVRVPGHAQVHFDGLDPQVGRLVKYATVDAHGDA